MIGRRRGAAACAVLLLLTVSPPAWSQTSPSGAADAASPPPVVEPASPRRENPGLINELGKLFRNPLTLAPLNPPPGIDDFGAAAPDGGSRLRLSSMVSGRERCPPAANGASDCKAAAAALCRVKGFADGDSLDTEATQSCSAEALLLSGRKSTPGACRTNYFVTRAMCR